MPANHSGRPRFGASGGYSQTQVQVEQPPPAPRPRSRGDRGDRGERHHYQHQHQQPPPQQPHRPRSAPRPTSSHGGSYLDVFRAQQSLELQAVEAEQRHKEDKAALEARELEVAEAEAKLRQLEGQKKQDEDVRSCVWLGRDSFIQGGATFLIYVIIIRDTHLCTHRSWSS